MNAQQMKALDAKPDNLGSNTRRYKGNRDAIP